MLVILGEQISNAYVDAQRAIGNWSPEPVSVGDLFAGALLPGLVLVGLYMLYLMGVAWLRPAMAPAIPRGELGQDQREVWRGIARAMVPPIVLIIAVLGSILAGVATPTEAAAVGAVGSLILAGARLARRGGLPLYAAGGALIVMMILANQFDLVVTRSGFSAPIIAAFVCSALLVYGVGTSLWRVWRAGVLVPVMRSTMQISAMVFVILIGAALFSLVFRGLGGDDMVHEALSNVPGGVIGAMFVVMLIMFALGFFLDFIEITFVVVPIIAPVLLRMDINPIWLGIMMAVNLQTSFLTPPFGFSPLLPARRGAALDPHRRHLQGRHPLRHNPAHRPRRARHISRAHHLAALAGIRLRGSDGPPDEALRVGAAPYRSRDHALTTLTSASVSRARSASSMVSAGVT